MRAWSSVLVLIALSCLLSATPASAAKGVKASDIMLPDGHLPITDAERALTSVPFAAGAPAVVLLDAKQYEFEENFVRVRTTRRLKILAEAGSRWGDYTMSFYGEARMGKIHARTILPDGTEVDATSGVHVESSKAPDMTAITVTFPRVSQGAILDLTYTVNADGYQIGEWIPQEGIPVIESRLMMRPPMGVRYRTALARMKPDEVEAHDLRTGTSTLYAWIFRNVAPIPGVPNRPPIADIAKKLILIRESYRYGAIVMPLASDWKSYCKDLSRFWDDWLKKRNSEASKLAAPLATAATPRDKAEGVRQALRTRMSAAYDMDFPMTASPDEALAQASASSADIAGVAIAMLRSLGVPAHAAAYRHRSVGTLPTEFPAPSMLDDVLVVVPGAGASGSDLYFSATSELPVGQLPLDALGVHVIPFRKDSPGPTWLPDVAADQNTLTREVRLELSIDGNVKGEALLTAKGPNAREWRSDLNRLSEAERKQDLEHLLRHHMPSAQITAWQVDGLEDEAGELAVTLKWDADSMAQRAGGRMLLNPFVFERVSAQDWGAETRELDIWLGRPFQREDTVTIVVPEGFETIQLAAGAKLEAGEVGGYVSSYTGKDLVLTATRSLKFATTVFPAASWANLKLWFQDMATSDDQSIVFTLPSQGE